MAAVHHENVVQYFGLEQIEGSCEKALVMEYCSGGNLQDLIDSRTNGLSSSEFPDFFQSLVAAIKHLREMNIIHRDMKPSNILLFKRSDGGIV